MSGAVSLRVGDDDRARATALLGEHYAHGRLDLAEFDERSTLAMMAVHQHELDALLADLPTLGEFRDGAPSVPGRRTRPSPRPPVALLVLLGVALVVLTQVPRCGSFRCCGGRPVPRATATLPAPT